VYLPAHGVVLEAESPAQCGGLLFATLDGDAWSLLEAGWMVDQEADRPAHAGRTFAVMPYEGEVDAADHPAFADALGRYQRVASTARLVRAGTWVDGRHLAAVARSSTGANVRIVGTERPRLWSAVFGDARVIRGRRREFGDRVECRPAQIGWPQGPAYTLDPGTLATIEDVAELLGELQRLAPDHGWWAAQQAFDRGNDIFVPRRARMAAQFRVLEALYGPYGRRGEPGLGAVVAATMAEVGADRDEIAGYVEGGLRAIRNHVAHGRALPDDAEIARDEQTLLDLVRRGLVHSAAWICGGHAPDGPRPPGPERTLARFRAWLGRDD
jgi:hypothetical protein